MKIGGVAKEIWGGLKKGGMGEQNNGKREDR